MNLTWFGLLRIASKCLVHPSHSFNRVEFQYVCRAWFAFCNNVAQKRGQVGRSAATACLQTIGRRSSSHLEQKVREVVFHLDLPKCELKSPRRIGIAQEGGKKIRRKHSTVVKVLMKVVCPLILA